MSVPGEACADNRQPSAINKLPQQWRWHGCQFVYHVPPTLVQGMQIDKAVAVIKQRLAHPRSTLLTERTAPAASNPR